MPKSKIILAAAIFLMSLNACLKHLFERADRVVVVMTGYGSIQFCCPLLARLRRDFIQVLFPKFRPRLLKFTEAPESVFLALRFDPRVAFKLSLEKFDRLAEFRGRCQTAGLLLLFQEICQKQLGVVYTSVLRLSRISLPPTFILP